MEVARRYRFLTLLTLLILATLLNQLRRKRAIMP